MRWMRTGDKIIGMPYLGAEAFAATLKSGNSKLSELDLSPNKIGDAGALALLDALKAQADFPRGRPRLRKLYMWGNDAIGEETKAALLALRDKAGLRIVDWSPPGSYEAPADQ